MHACTQAFLHPSAGEFNNYRLSWMGQIPLLQYLLTSSWHANSTDQIASSHGQLIATTDDVLYRRCRHAAYCKPPCICVFHGRDDRNPERSAQSDGDALSSLCGMPMLGSTLAACPGSLLLWEICKIQHMHQDNAVPLQVMREFCAEGEQQLRS